MNTATLENKTLAHQKWINITLVLISVTGGLAIDRHSGLGGQLAVSLGVWLVFFRIVYTSPPEWRLAFYACLLFATAGEIFLSLDWGLYTYRLHNIPLFIPPGHVLLFYFGLVIAPHVPKILTTLVLPLAILYAAIAWINNMDTLSIPLAGIFLIYTLLRPKEKHLASLMFIIALLLELYGTWMGNWTWHSKVPHLALNSHNPPIAAGAFYCGLDMLIGLTVLVIQKQKRGLRDEV